MASNLAEVASNRCFSGLQKIFSYDSSELGCKTNFGVYLPDAALVERPVKLPMLFWLSGLTCTETNFIQKAGFQKYASEHQLIVVNPDTSPRGCNIEGDNHSYDFGVGAGFYIDATEEKWKEHYRMYSYVSDELPKLIEENFPVIPNKAGIFGHSMGGHGALICALKNPIQYVSVSAFAPICNPCQCAWGQKAFTGYLGEDKELWKQCDATQLMKEYKGPALDILIDQGEADEFYKSGQLLPDNFVSACAEAGAKLQMRMQPGYDHSYFFIATFMEDHIKHHAKILKA